MSQIYKKLIGTYGWRVLICIQIAYAMLCPVPPITEKSHNMFYFFSQEWLTGFQGSLVIVSGEIPQILVKIGDPKGVHSPSQCLLVSEVLEINFNLFFNFLLGTQMIVALEN